MTQKFTKKDKKNKKKTQKIEQGLLKTPENKNQNPSAEQQVHAEVISIPIISMEQNELSLLIKNKQIEEYVERGKKLLEEKGEIRIICQEKHIPKGISVVEMMKRRGGENKQ